MFRVGSRVQREKEKEREHTSSVQWNAAAGPLKYTSHLLPSASFSSSFLLSLAGILCSQNFFFSSFFKNLIYRALTYRGEKRFFSFLFFFFHVHPINTTTLHTYIYVYLWQNPESRIAVFILFLWPKRRDKSFEINFKNFFFSLPSFSHSISRVCYIYRLRGRRKFILRRKSCEITLMAIAPYKIGIEHTDFCAKFILITTKFLIYIRWSFRYLIIISKN